MKTKLKPYTPGPWEFGTDGVTDDYVITGPRKKFIALVDNGYDWNNVANARLIAAAPTLLLHLKVAAKFYSEELEEIGPCDHDVNVCVCEIKYELEDIRATIAEAEGR